MIYNPIRFVFHVGIDLPELIRLKLACFHPHHYSDPKSRDWSAWIDTIETSPQLFVPLWSSLRVGIDLPELIRLKLFYTKTLFRWSCGRRDWSAWIDTIETPSIFDFFSVFKSSGLICLNWYDWNYSAVQALHLPYLVGIDLPELIRLKHTSFYSLNSYLYPVGIDLPELIRLKQYNYFSSFLVSLCRDWSAWIDTIETLQQMLHYPRMLSPVGIDLPELIRLKP